MKKRTFHHIYDQHVEKAHLQGGEVKHSYSFKVRDVEIESEDVFEDDIELFVFPIEYLNHIDSILRTYNFNDSAYYFFDQCKDVISVSEKHIDEQGKGKMSFKSLFHNFPYSVCSINDTALVLVGLHPQPQKDLSKPRDYFLTGYIHVNKYIFEPEPGKQLNGFYYNLLRISEKEVDGVALYKRKKIFTLFFTVMLNLTYSEKVDFSYACMGRENQGIKDALHRSATYYKIHYERLPFQIFSHVNWIYGSKSAAKQVVDISEDEEQLKKMYKMVYAKFKNYVFFHLITEESFLNLVKKIISYSRTSRVYMLPDSNGEIASATIALNWGDYFAFIMQNPKGIFQLIDKLGIMKKFLYFILSVGEPEAFKKLSKGLSHLYRVKHGVQVTFLPTPKSDPYFKFRKSIISDEYIYFIICHQPDDLLHFKKLSEDDNGNMRLFVDQPLI